MVLGIYHDLATGSSFSEHHFVYTYGVHLCKRGRKLEGECPTVSDKHYKCEEMVGTLSDW